MAAMSGANANVYAMSGTHVDLVAGTAMTANGDRTIFTITDATKRYWDPDVLPTFKLGAVAHPLPSGTQICYAGGTVIFPAAVAAGALTLDTGAYFTITSVAGGKEWSMDAKLETVNGVQFGDTWKTFAPIVKGATISIARWWADGSYLGALTAGALVGLDLAPKTDSGDNYHYCVLGRLVGDSIKVATDALVEESLDFESSGHVTIYSYTS